MKIPINSNLGNLLFEFDGDSLKDAVVEAVKRRINLRYADLRCADLRGADGVFMQCPEVGQFIAFKKCHNNRIVTLMIADDARRSSSTSRKCRCDKAMVLKIESVDGEKSFTEALSTYDSSFKYEVGKTVEEPNFDENRWNECSSGIHFFITRQEAVDY